MGAGFSTPETRFVATYAPTDRATCRKCGKKIAKGAVRVTREVDGGFGGKDGIVMHYHAGHALDAAKGVKCTTAPPVLVVDALTTVDAKKWTQKFAEVVLAARAKKCAT